MKKFMIIGAMAVCVMTLLVGCNSQPAKESSKDDTEIIASSTAGNTEKSTEIAETEDNTEIVDGESEPITESTATTSEKPKDNATKQETVQRVIEQKVQNTEQTSKASKPEVTSPAKEETKTTQPTKEPTATKPQKQETTKPAETVTESVAEKPKAESFDASPYVNHAISYANSIGLATGTVATECWDNPISANPKKANINGDIESRLNRYVNEGCEGVWIWSVKESETEYLIYIGYY